MVGQPVEVVRAIPWVQNWMQTGLIRLPEAGIITADQLLAGIDRDIIVLALPEMARLAPYVVGLVAAGGLAAALSTASGLLIVVSSSIAHDIYGRLINPDAPEARKLLVGRIAIAFGVLVAGYLGINPPGFVAEVVAFAFGLAAASFFPVIVLGIFWKRATKQGAIWGMITGLAFTTTAILLIRTPQILGAAAPVIPDFFGINAQGVGTVGMMLNFLVLIVVSLMTPPPPPDVQAMVESIRYPRVMPARASDPAAAVEGAAGA
jgi:cation/acetate symporter